MEINPNTDQSTEPITDQKGPAKVSMNAKLHPEWTHICIPRSVHKILKARAQAEGMGMGALVREMLIRDMSR